MAYNEESDFATGIYRCNDSIKNFKISVRLQHERSTLLPEPRNPAPEAGVQAEEATFEWQQKAFSPFEVSFYRHMGNCHTALQERYHEEVMARLARGDQDTRLFTYTDADDFADLEEVNQSMTTDAHPVMSPLVAGMVELRRRRRSGGAWGGRREGPEMVDFAPSAELRRRNRFPRSAPQSYFILGDLSVQDSTDAWAGRSEYVLCCVRWDPATGVLAVSPDFNPDGAPPYRIEVDGDARNTYQYWLGHSSAELGPEHTDRHHDMMSKLYQHRAEVRSLQVGEDFSVPRRGVLNCLVLGEIRQAEHFDSDHLHVRYRLALPPGWSCDSPEQLMGVTPSCRTRGTGIANLGHVFQALLTLHLDPVLESVPPWPQLLLEVASLDGWGRYRTEGYGRASLPPFPGPYPLTVGTWRPLDTSPVGEMRRFFVGGTPQLRALDYAGVPDNFKGSLLGKCNLVSQSSGVVRLHLHLVHQTQPLSRVSTHHPHTPERLGVASLVSSVNSAVEAFQEARRRMLRARQALVAE